MEAMRNAPSTEERASHNIPSSQVSNPSDKTANIRQCEIDVNIPATCPYENTSVDVTNLSHLSIAWTVT